MRVGTYPTRDFATLGPLELRPPFTGASVQSFTHLSGLTPPFNLPALGRRQSLYFGFSPLQRPRFLVNSRQSCCAAAPLSFTGLPLHPKGRPLSRSYGALLPSSLARVLSDALGFSPLPTCGGLRYGHLLPSPRGFSWRHGIRGVSLAVARNPCPPQPVAGDFPPALRPTWADTPCPFGVLPLSFPVPPRFIERAGGAGIFTGCPFAYAFRPRLRSRLTLRRLTFRRNPWAFGAPGFHRGCRYSFRDSHSPPLQRPLPVLLLR